MITTPNFKAVKDVEVAPDAYNKSIMSFIGYQKDLQPFEAWSWWDGPQSNASQVFNARQNAFNPTFISLSDTYMLLPDGMIAKNYRPI